VGQIEADLPVLLRPLGDPLLVGLVVVKRKDRRDVRPGVRVGRDGNAALDDQAKRNTSAARAACGRARLRRSMTRAVGRTCSMALVRRS